MSKALVGFPTVPTVPCSWSRDESLLELAVLGAGVPSAVEQAKESSIQMMSTRDVGEGGPPPAARSNGAVHDGTENGVSRRHLRQVLSLGRECRFEEQHAHQVTRLALRLFDELSVVHGLGTRERQWLQYAALLHDMGLIEGPQGHHESSLRIILHSPVLPFDETERQIVGFVAWYHSGELTQARHKRLKPLTPALQRSVTMLAALLRLADALDYTHQNVVRDLACTVTQQEVAIRCGVIAEPSSGVDRSGLPEQQRALRKGDLLQQVSRRALRVECYGG